MRQVQHPVARLVHHTSGQCRDLVCRQILIHTREVDSKAPFAQAIERVVRTAVRDIGAPYHQNMIVVPHEIVSLVVCIDIGYHIGCSDLRTVRILRHGPCSVHCHDIYHTVLAVRQPEAAVAEAPVLCPIVHEVLHTDQHSAKAPSITRIGRNIGRYEIDYIHFVGIVVHIGAGENERFDIDSDFGRVGLRNLFSFRFIDQQVDFDIKMSCLVQAGGSDTILHRGPDLHFEQVVARRENLKPDDNKVAIYRNIHPIRTEHCSFLVCEGHIRGFDFEHLVQRELQACASP